MGRSVLDHDEGDEEDGRGGEEADGGGAAPAPEEREGQGDEQGREGKAEEEGSEDVYVAEDSMNADRGAITGFGPEQVPAGDEGRDRDGHVDQKDPVPAPVGDQESAERRSGRQSDVHGHDVDPQSPPLSLIHISEPTRLGMISYAVF